MGERGNRVILVRPVLVSVRNIAHFDLYFRVICSRLMESCRLVPCFLIKLRIDSKKMLEIREIREFSVLFLNFQRLNICLGLLEICRNWSGNGQFSVVL